MSAVATHIHWNHIGGHKYYPDFYAHEAEPDWLSGGFAGETGISRTSQPGYSTGNFNTNAGCFPAIETGWKALPRKRYLPLRRLGRMVVRDILQ